MVIDENTFNQTIKSKGVKLDGWYLGKQDYQPSIQDYTYKQIGQRLNYCPYCGTKLIKAEETLEAKSDNNTL